MSVEKRREAVKKAMAISENVDAFKVKQDSPYEQSLMLQLLRCMSASKSSSKGGKQLKIDAA